MISLRKMEYIKHTMTWTLKAADTFYGPNLSFTTKDVLACYLRASKTMALLFTRIDCDIIKLI